jgi:hypothetical protein
MLIATRSLQGLGRLIVPIDDDIIPDAPVPIVTHTTVPVATVTTVAIAPTPKPIVPVAVSQSTNSFITPVVADVNSNSKPAAGSSAVADNTKPITPDSLTTNSVVDTTKNAVASILGGDRKKYLIAGGLLLATVLATLGISGAFSSKKA